MTKRLLVLLSFLIFTDVPAANDRAFLWQVSSDSTTVYLLGSIHFADQSFYPLRREIEDAFERSSYLMVELDISRTNTDEYNQLLAKSGSYQDGSTIRDAISDDTWQQLKKQLQLLNVPYDAIKNYKPGVIVLTLSAVQLMQMGLDPQLGIDAYFLARASRQPDKQIMQFETLEQQLNLFINVADGELLLKESLDSIEEGEALMTELVSIWKQGDLRQMNRLLFEDVMHDYPAFSEIYDSLFYRRNERMTEKIDALLQQKAAHRNYIFVVVGSGHLIGERGIVNALKDRGYSVERL